MKIILHKLLVVVFVGLFTNTLVAKEYKVAIFDYDIREKNKQSVAKYIEEKLLNTKHKFKKLEHFSGANTEINSLRVLKKLDNENYDLIITITSDSMVPATHTLKNTPWLFTNINNPKFFGIRDINKPGNKKSGVTYYVPVIKQIEFFNQVLNNKLQKVGLIFDYYAKSRRAELVEFREVCLTLNIKYDIKLIKGVEDFPKVTKELLADNVDAIIVTSSGKLYNNIDKILNLTNDKKVPIFSVNKKGVPNGALSALASDYYKMVDENLIPMVLDVLQNGKNPGNMPIQYSKNPLIYINQTQANKLGLDISTGMLKSASRIY